MTACRFILVNNPVDWWKMFTLAILVFAIWLLPRPADAKELFVNNSGSPACSDQTSYAENSSTLPWCSLLRAVRGNADANRNSSAVPSQAAQAGDTVFVSAGTYDYTGAAYEGPSWLSVFYDPINTGSPGAWIEFEADGNVVLTGNQSGRASMIGSNQAQYIKWTGFTLNEALSSYRNGLVTANVDNVWFDRNTIIGQYANWNQDDNHPGMMIHGPRNGDCTGGINNIRVTNNTIRGFKGNNGRNDAGMTLYCLGDNILIENNTIFDNQTGINAKSSYLDSNNITVRKNLFRDNLGDAIAMQAFSDWHVYQNVMANNLRGFVFFNTIYYVGNTKPNDTYVVNNTMYNNGEAGIFFKSLCENLNNNHVVNNLIVGSSAIIADNASCATVENMGIDDVRFDWNFYDLSGPFYVDFVPGFSTWLSSYGQDSNSSFGTSPLFVDAMYGDFRLQASSTARGLGQDILDLNGNDSTNDQITVGAYITGSEVIGVSHQGSAPNPPGNVQVN